MQIVHTQYLRLKEKVNILYSFTQSLNLLSISYFPYIYKSTYPSPYFKALYYDFYSSVYVRKKCTFTTSFILEHNGKFTYISMC